MRATNSLEPLYQGPLLLLVEAEGAVERFALTNQFIQVGKGSESYAEHARRLYPQGRCSANHFAPLSRKALASISPLFIVPLRHGKVWVRLRADGWHSCCTARTRTRTLDGAT